jgi:acyl-CoA thioesterase
LRCTSTCRSIKEFALGFFEAETAITRVGEREWQTRLSSNWNIGPNSNGGYAMSSVLRALREMTGMPDPVSVTVHFLRPVQGDTDCDIQTSLIRTGRTMATAQGTLQQGGKDRLVVIAAFGNLESQAGIGPELGPPPPELPPVEDCVARANLKQGVALPLLSRIDCVLHPDCVEPGERALIEGWVRFADGADASTLSLPCFVDVFPPSLTALVGNTGWVPTIELTTQVRRAPKPGWLRARFECDDLHKGRMIETGALWDASGAIVARSRQIGLLLKK